MTAFVPDNRPVDDPPGADAVLMLTGERTVPGLAVENYWFRRHEVVYQRLAQRCAGRDVLEAGCGEGYGADLIAGSHVGSSRWTTTPPRWPTCAPAIPRVEVMHANLTELPLADGSVDVVVNFQVIEHLWDQPGFVRECARVLRPSGLLMVSTPNRITFSPGRDTPINPFHTRELNAAELIELLVDGGLHDGGGVRGFPWAAAAGLGRASWRLDHRRPDRQGDRRRALAGRAADAMWPSVTIGRLRRGGVRRPARQPPHRRQPRPGRDRGAAVTRMTTCAERVPGLFTLVLHTHLPWLAHHGRWPVGEEWLYQSWSAAYLPLLRVLHTLAGEDRHGLVTLGMTPVVTAQLDDPYCLDGMYHWLANWQLRAAEAASARPALTPAHL